MRAAGWQNRLIEDVPLAKTQYRAPAVQRRWTGLTLDHARQRVEIVERLISQTIVTDPLGRSVLA